MRQTAVPDFVSGPMRSQTKRYAPPALDCVLETRSVERLQVTLVASRWWPESRSITSGVRLVHQVGGSTFVTTGALAVVGCCGAAARRVPLEKKCMAKIASRTKAGRRKELSEEESGGSIFTRKE